MNKFAILFISIFFLSCYNNHNKIVKSNLSIKKLSLREKIAQMIMVRVNGEFYNSSSYYHKKINNSISQYKVGGIITYGGSIHGTFFNLKEYQKISKIPLLVAADYERGLGGWMSGGTLFPTNMAIAASQNKSFAYRQGLVTANEAKILGVNMIFAPVLDVNNNSDNPIINFRSYSDNPNIVSEFGVEFIRGIQENGLLACAKHFPGHGNTSVDSHSKLPIINSTLKELNQVELLPFKAAVDNNVSMIMTGHITVPALDSLNFPATHSKKILNQLLRKEWGYNGLIISDALEMGALTEDVGIAESAIRAINAGVDILLLPLDVGITIEGVVDAVYDGRISEERINQSVLKILAIKDKLNKFNANSNWMNVKEQIGKRDSKLLALEIAESSITLVKDDLDIVPFKYSKNDSICHLILSLDEDSRSQLKTFSKDLQKTSNHVKEIFVNNTLTDLGITDIVNQAKGADRIIISMLIRIKMNKGISTIDSTHNLLLKKLRKLKIPIIGISFGSPYLPNYEFLDAYIASYGYGSISLKATANILWGRKPITGKLPVNLNSKYPIGHGISRNNYMEGSNYNMKNNVNFGKAWDDLQSAINNRLFPGAQVFIYKKDNIYITKEFGHQTYEESSDKIDKNTLYDVASLTKAIATTPIVMKLVSQKKISLNHKVSDYYPNSRLAQTNNEIRIKHLLSHSSGLKGYVDFFNENNIKNKHDIVKSIVDTKSLEFNPGKKAQYSDLGFILLSDIIKKSSGKSLDQLFKSWICEPMQLKNTFFNPKLEFKDRIVPTEFDSKFRKKMVHGIVHDENAFLMGGVSGHAGVFSTAEEIGKIGILFLNRGYIDGKRLVSEKLMDEFIKPPSGINTSYTLGWDRPLDDGNSSAGKYFSKTTFGHLGFTGTSIWIDPESDIVIVLLTNRIYPNRGSDNEFKAMKNTRITFHNNIMKELLGV